MMKLWILACILTFYLFIGISFAAQDCSSFYDLFSVNISSLTLDKTVYSPNEIIHGSFNIQNKFPQPVTEGKVKVQVLYVPQDAELRYGEHIVDEFYINEDINLREGEIKKIEFYYLIPKSTKGGTYRIALYFYGGSYQLGGASSLPNLYANSILYEVQDLGYNKELLKFDRGNIYVSEKQYDPLATIGIEREQNESMILNVPLINDGTSGMINVTYEILVWEDLKHKRAYESTVNGKLPQDSSIYQELLQTSQLAKNGLIPMAAGSRVNITYNLGRLLPEAYVVRVTAAKEDQKAILLIRLPVKGEKAGIAYSGLSKFPLVKNDPATISLCSSITTESEPIFELGDLIIDDENGSTLTFKTTPILANQLNATIKVDLISKNTTITSQEANLTLTAKPQGISFSFTAPENLSSATLITRIYSDRRLLDEERIDYDLINFKRSKSLFLTASSIPGQADYEITLLNEVGEPEIGQVNIIATSTNGTLGALAQNQSFSGKLTGSLKLAKGSYNLSVYDTLNGLSASTNVNVEELYIPPTSVPFEKDPVVIISIGIILIALVFLAYKYMNKL